MKHALHLARLSRRLGRLASVALIVAVIGARTEAPTAAADEVRDVPHLITVMGDSPTTLAVAWQDRSANEQSFEIRVATTVDPATTKDARIYKAPALTGVGSTGAYTVTGLTDNTIYCVRVSAFLGRSGRYDVTTGLSDMKCASTKAARLNAHVQAPAQSRCVACPAAGIVGKPSHFSGRRDNVFGTTVILTWDASPAASFYQLRAVSHQSGTPLGLDSQADDIAGRQHTFVVQGTAAQVQGGTDFYLSACSAPGVCGQEAMTFVPGP
jgi:hypothetical protein